MRANFPVLRRPAQSLVEFALIAPVLIAVLFGIIELGLVFNIYTSLTNSAREGARAGSVFQVTAPLLTSSDASAADTQRLAYITTVINNTANPTIDPATELTVNVLYLPATPATTNLYRSGDTVTVQITYPHQLFFGLLGPQVINVQATSSMRIEQGGMR